MKNANNFMILLSQIFIMLSLCIMLTDCSAEQHENVTHLSETIPDETQLNNMRQENPLQVTNETASDAAASTKAVASDAQPEGKIKVSNMILGENGEWDFAEYPLKEYEDKLAVLAECGFAKKEPYYQYYDESERLNMELYLDEAAKKGCGFFYGYNSLPFSGFIFDGMQAMEWDDSTYSTLTFDGIDAATLENVTQVSSDYTDDGRLLSYEVRGVTDYAEVCQAEGIEPQSADETLLSINWFYREDGTLCRRDYYHNSRAFVTTAQIQTTYYDELGRAAYREEYITHGMVYYYYIYEGADTEPKYCLTADNNFGEYYITMAVFQ